MDSGDFYYSYDFDISNTMQRQHNFAEEGEPEPLYRRVLDISTKFLIFLQFDDRFFWNKHLLTDNLLTLELKEWILPIIRGHIQMFDLVSEGKLVEFALISRRSRFRAGTRYHTRGVDHLGNTSNFIETEQIVCVDGTVASFVQIRYGYGLFHSGLK